MSGGSATAESPTADAEETRPSAGADATRRIWLLTLLTLALGIALYTSVIRRLAPLHTPRSISFWALAALFALAEVFVIHVEFRQEAHSSSLSDIALVIGLFFATASNLVLAQLVGAALALAIHRRQSLMKLCFNLSHFLLSTTASVLVFRVIAGNQSPMHSAGLLAAFVATLGTSWISVGMIFRAIVLSEGRQSVEVPKLIGLAALITMANTSLGLIAAITLWFLPEAWWILLVPAGTLFLAYRAYTLEREKHQSLEFLYASTSILHQSAELDAAVIAFLGQAREMFHAGVAEITFVPANADEVTLRTVVGPGEHVEVLSDVPAGEDEVMGRIVSERRSMLLNPTTGDARFRNLIEARGLKDAMVTSLRGENRVIGAMLVGDRLGEVSTFGSDDLRLFETLANHVSVAIENGRLEQSLTQLRALEKQLTHQAFHDSLTNLANRALFADHVRQALARRDTQPVSVIFVDLDDFKTVNDSLGHAAGDELLSAVAERLRTSVRASDTAARLGGDEFAILLDNDPTTDPIDVARRVIEALAEPVMIQGKEIAVHASFGIASGIPGHSEADELLRNADTAMYMAKANGKGSWQVFEPGMHLAVVQRHELKEDLEQAVERDEFVLHYQPLVDLVSRRIIGVEALVRWQHPRRGLVPPGVFIPLAEETGLVLPIGRFVLREACRQVKEWQALGPDAAALAVSVNLSPRQLQQPDFVAEVGEVLREFDITPRDLILELTENLAVQDSEATVRVLHELKALGVRIALDDFGTGYSSLNYLRRLPIDILKMAKPFVDDLGTGAHESAFAHAIVRLGQTLGLQIVAEGIEQHHQLTQLRELQCDLGQGFFFARALERVAMEQMLRKALGLEPVTAAGEPQPASAR